MVFVDVFESSSTCEPLFLGKVHDETDGEAVLSKVDVLSFLQEVVVGFVYNLIQELKNDIVSLSMLQHVYLMELLLYDIIAHPLHIPSDQKQHLIFHLFSFMLHPLLIDHLSSLLILLLLDSSHLILRLGIAYHTLILLYKELLLHR